MGSLLWPRRECNDLLWIMGARPQIDGRSLRESKEAVIVVGFDQIRKEKPKNKDCWLGGTCKIDQQKCKYLLQLGLCKGHVCANGFTIRFSTVIKAIKDLQL